jgi:DNA-binding protein HU-beta
MLTERIAQALNVSLPEARRIVEAVRLSIQAELLEGNKVMMKGLGTLSILERKERTGRNLQTGKTIKIPARKAVRFGLSPSFKEKLSEKKAGKKSRSR